MQKKEKESQALRGNESNQELFVWLLQHKDMKYVLKQVGDAQLFEEDKKNLEEARVWAIESLESSEDKDNHALATKLRGSRYASSCEVGFLFTIIEIYKWSKEDLNKANLKEKQAQQKEIISLTNRLVELYRDNPRLDFDAGAILEISREQKILACAPKKFQHKVKQALERALGSDLASICVIPPWGVPVAAPTMSDFLNSGANVVQDCQYKLPVTKTNQDNSRAMAFARRFGSYVQGKASIRPPKLTNDKWIEVAIHLCKILFDVDFQFKAMENHLFQKNIKD